MRCKSSSQRLEVAFLRPCNRRPSTELYISHAMEPSDTVAVLCRGITQDHLYQKRCSTTRVACSCGQYYGGLVSVSTCKATPPLFHPLHLERKHSSHRKNNYLCLISRDNMDLVFPCNFLLSYLFSNAIFLFFFALANVFLCGNVLLGGHVVFSVPSHPLKLHATELL